MFVNIENIGPHDSLRLRVPELAEIEGGSESGKTHVSHALALAICGVDADGRTWDSRRRRDTDLKGYVEISVPGGGLSVRRSFGVRVGSARVDGVGTLSSQTKLDEALGMTGRRDLVLSILAPGYWRRLLATPKARGMRDMLATVLPPVDIRAIVAETMEAHGGLQDGDPLHLGSRTSPGGVLHLQREANAARDRCEGALVACAAALATVEQGEPQPADPGSIKLARRRVDLEADRLAYVQRAKIVATNEQRLADHDRQLQAWERRRQQHADRQAVARRGWQQRRDALGEQPAAPGYKPPAMSDHRQRVTAARAQVDQLVAKLEELDAAEAAAEALVERSTADARAAARAERATLDAMLQAGKCPTCGHEVSEAELQAQRELADRADREHRDALATARQQHAEAVAVIEASEKATEAELRTARAMLTSAEQRQAIAQQSVDRHAAAVRARDEWIARHAALGDAPADVRFQEPRPVLQLLEVGPNVRRPDVDHLPTLEEARATIAAAERHAERVADWKRAHARAQSDADTARSAVQASSLEADRVAALVQAVREAPTVAARRQIEALHRAMALDGVRVCISGPEESGDLVTVERDGLPWWMASNGAQVVLELVLRDALRRLATGLDGLSWLAEMPIIVDNAQDWSGDWPVDCWSGPVWWLHTTAEHGDGLTVFDASEE
jgi:hypothetical protein